jgi:hypothetical protein
LLGSAQEPPAEEPASSTEDSPDRGRYANSIGGRTGMRRAPDCAAEHNPSSW